MTTIDILFRKVFRNKILFNLIYEYVHCKENVLDWTIKSLLERNQGEKFKEIMDYNLYSEITENNWFYEITPKESDILPLLRYRELKTSTLKEFYWKYKYLFLKKKLKDKIISESLKGGNIEIVNFLIEQGFEYKYRGFDHIGRLYGGVFEQVLNCGDSVDCYNFILTALPNFLPIIKKDTTICWLIEYFSSKGYSNIYPIIIPLLYSSIMFEHAIKISFKNLDLKLANKIIKRNNKLNLITKSSIIGIVANQSNFIMNDQYFEIFSTYLSNTTTTNPNTNEKWYDINLFERVKNSAISKDKVIYCLKLRVFKEDSNFLSSFINFQYLPNTLKEFNYMFENILNYKNILFSSHNLYRFSKHLSTEILDLEYSKQFINEYNKIQPFSSSFNKDYSMCVKILCDSTPKISSYFLKEKLSKEMVSYEPLYNTPLNNNCYFGNLEILKLAEKEYSLIPTFDTLYKAVENGYTEIVEYLCDFKKLPSRSSRQFSPLKHMIQLLILCEKNNQLQSFIKIIESKFFKSLNQLDCRIFIECMISDRVNFKSKFLYYLFKEKIITSISIFQRYCKNDLNLFLLFKPTFNDDDDDENCKCWINQEYFFQLIEHSNIEIFQNIISDQLFLSSYLATDKLKDKFIITLISSDSRRLLYFILNSSYLNSIGFNKIFKNIILFSKSPSITINQLITITTNTNTNNNDLNNFYNCLLLYLIFFFDKNTNIIKEIKLFTNQFENNYFQGFKEFANQILSEKNQKKLKDNYLNILNSSNILNQIGLII
ncbi:hypothetical protein ACTFIU_000364 [Dictyostelium citrinum]